MSGVLVEDWQASSFHNCSRGRPDPLNIYIVSGLKAAVGIVDGGRQRCQRLRPLTAARHGEGNGACRRPTPVSKLEADQRGHSSPVCSSSRMSASSALLM
eukprot:5319045-Prymnesium_polylepis.1